MAETFTVFSKFGDVLESLSEQDARELSYALMMYGTLGVEVECGYVAKALFTAFREDIDNSKEMRSRGSRGGRPSKKPQENEVSENQKPQVSEIQKPVVSEIEKPQVSGKPRKTESQTKPNQTNPSQNRESEERAPERDGFEPPGAEEVRAYFGANGFTADPDAFLDHFEAQGWVRSNGQPVLDWRALARAWCRKQRGFDAAKPERQRAAEERAASLAPPVNRQDAEAALAEAEERARRLGVV